MLSRLIFLVLLYTTLGSATRVKIYNYCPQQLTITEKTNGENKRNLMCKLPIGVYCYSDYTKADTWLSFQNGYAGK
jgi:hypothetical protein